MNFSTYVQVAVLTDVGMRRATNQDAHAVIIADTPELWRSRGHIFLVADGMGAHAAGELASKLAADGIPHLYHKHVELSPPEALERAIRETNGEIHRRGQANPEFHNMGTTCTGLVLLPQGALVANIGDSRTYRLRGKDLHQLTFDHSLQWELRAAGQFPPGSELAAAIPKNVITRSLGPNSQVRPDIEGPWAIEVGDTFLLCSDGLTGKVEDVEIGVIISVLPPDEAARALVDLANLRGGPDNCTVVIAKVLKAEMSTAASAEPPITLGVSTTRKPIPPIFWLTAGICLFAAVVLAIVSQLLLAGIAAVAAVVVAASGWIRQYMPNSRAVVLEGGRHLGKGPYTHAVCTPDSKLLKNLQATIDELREAARDGAYTIHWPDFDEHIRRAQAGEKAGDFAEAIRQSCRGISFLMKELRSQGGKKASDSAIQY